MSALIRWWVMGCWLVSVGVHADTPPAVPDYQAFPAAGTQRLLWVASERGRAEPEMHAARKLARQGVEVWSTDTLSAYFLPQLPRSMDQVPPHELAAWIGQALADGRQVTVYAVARAAVPVLRAAAALGSAQRSRVGVILMYPNLYTVAEPLAEPDYLDVGDLSGLRVRVVQPRRSAATPWLPGLLAHLQGQGARTSSQILDNLREGFWGRETPTEFETQQAQRLDALILTQLKTVRSK